MDEQRPPRAPSRFARGMGYPFRAARLVLENPSLLPLCLAPVATGLVLVVGMFFSLQGLISGLQERWFGGHSWWQRLLGALLALFAFVLLFMLVYFVFAALVSVAASPFCSRLSEKVTAKVTGRPLPAQSLGVILVEAARAVGHALLRALLYVGIALPIWLLGLVIPFLSPFLAPLSFYVTATFVAYDYIDYPLSIHRAQFGDKWKYIHQHKAACLGLGTSVALLLLIPVVNLLAPPLAAVGATLMVVEEAAAATGEAPTSS